MKVINCFIYLLCVFFVSINAQNSNGLGNVSGKTFTEQSVEINAYYDANRQFCELNLQGKSSNVWKIAEKFVPISTRGRLISEKVKMTDYYENRFKVYENVEMTISDKEGKTNLKFLFKDRKCLLKSTAQYQEKAGLPYLPPIIYVNQLRGSRVESRDWYGKYEMDQPAVIIYLPLPELTSEASENFAPDEMTVQAILTPDGDITNIVHLGFLKNGMGDRVTKAFKKIKFKPAILEGRAVPQRIHILYGIKKCADGKICTYASEILGN